MHAPDRLIAHLREHQYHPRSNAHGNAVCLGVLDDLIDSCPAISSRAADGELVAALNYSVRVGHDDWNIDLAIGPPAAPQGAPHIGRSITFASPSVVQIAIESKAVMTEHGKARRNRLRDFQAFHRHAHEYDDRTAAGAIIVVNVAPTFWSPTRAVNDITLHKNIAKIGKETVDIYRSLPQRTTSGTAQGLRGLAIIVVEHDNLGLNPQSAALGRQSAPARLVVGSPAPAPGDPLHYSTMLRRLCDAYRARFGG